MRRFADEKERWLYETWSTMKKRCSNPNHDSYPHYGGRGITVCDRWRSSFEAFQSDMGPKPSREYSIDRIDTNGNYEPSNCRWATPAQQYDNQRKRTMKHAQLPNGWTKLSKKAGIHHGIVYRRVVLFGWTLERALSTPPNKMWDGSKHRSYPRRIKP